MIVTCLVVIAMAMCCQASINITDPAFSVTNPTCSSLYYYPGEDQAITLTITITNEGNEQLPAAANGDNFEVLFYVYPLPDDVEGLPNQQTDGDNAGGGYMQMPSSVFTVTSTASLADAIDGNEGSITVTGTTNIRVPSDDYCTTYEDLCVSLRLTQEAEDAGAGMGENNRDNQNGECNPFGCSPDSVGNLDCDGSGAATTTLSIMAAVLWGLLMKMM